MCVFDVHHGRITHRLLSNLQILPMNEEKLGQALPTFIVRPPSTATGIALTSTLTRMCAHTRNVSIRKWHATTRTPISTRRLCYTICALGTRRRRIYNDSCRSSMHMLPTRQGAAIELDTRRPSLSVCLSVCPMMATFLTQCEVLVRAWCGGSTFSSRTSPSGTPTCWHQYRRS